LFISPRVFVVKLIPLASKITSMAKKSSELNQIILRYRQEVEKMGIHVEQILLYGSWANGTARQESDIDLFVISSDWEKYNQRERLEMLGVASARILESVQAQGITPNEIANRQLTTFWQHVLNEQAVAV
jgi:uncharacterized protein